MRFVMWHVKVILTPSKSITVDFLLGGLIDDSQYINKFLVCFFFKYDKYKSVSKAVARALEIGNHVDQVILQRDIFTC